MSLQDDLQFLRPKEVMGRLKCGKTPFYDQVNAGLLPPLVKLGGRTSAIPSHELDAVMAYRIAGKTEEQIRGLVNRLVDERQKAAEVY